MVKKESSSQTPNKASKISHLSRKKTHGITLNREPFESPKVVGGLTEKHIMVGKGMPPVRKLSMLSYQEEATIVSSATPGGNSVN